MKSIVLFGLLCLQLNCLFVHADVLVGGDKEQPVEITSDLKLLVNDGLRQANALGGDFKISEPKEIIVMRYATQVVAGILSKLLMEVRFSQGSKLVSVELWDQPWTGKYHQLTKTCVYTSDSDTFYPSQCDSATNCGQLLQQKGTCQQPST
eukprot:CAMPEP_0176455714 /NCGR_PEP_ID=MMETSP0127-20121128/30802_1 /TAXON_ID=938130 /ORGANISM="Platyophrya macrostoma, Strain WH" /LENGTH=150 /DNA_ID=CAMNT_0017845425 /DNA_START=12 /DNA_END=464 /DNA_ORIENTATION=-